MDSKYYTLELEDFVHGLEYTHVRGDSGMEDMIFDVYNLNYFNPEGGHICKFLDQSDIESFGFKLLEFDGKLSSSRYL